MYRVIANFYLGDFKVEGALEVLTNYVLHLRQWPQYVDYRRHPGLDKVSSILAHTMMTHRDRYGGRVYIFRPGKWDPADLTFTHCYCYSYMLAEMVALEPKSQVKITSVK
jgi:hypothetical protein